MWRGFVKYNCGTMDLRGPTDTWDGNLENRKQESTYVISLRLFSFPQSSGHTVQVYIAQEIKMHSLEQAAFFCRSRVLGMLKSRHVYTPLQIASWSTKKMKYKMWHTLKIPEIWTKSWTSMNHLSHQISRKGSWWKALSWTAQCTLNDRIGVGKQNGWEYRPHVPRKQTKIRNSFSEGKSRILEFILAK